MRASGDCAVPPCWDWTSLGVTRDVGHPGSLLPAFHAFALGRHPHGFEGVTRTLVGRGGRSHPLADGREPSRPARSHCFRNVISRVIAVVQFLADSSCDVSVCVSSVDAEVLAAPGRDHVDLATEYVNRWHYLHEKR